MITWFDIIRVHHRSQGHTVCEGMIRDAVARSLCLIIQLHSNAIIIHPEALQKNLQERSRIVI